MQIKNQWKRPRDWKVVAGAGAVAALGITGLVLANPADGTVPDAISLEDRARIAETTVPRPLPLTGIINLSDLEGDLDSPFDDNGGDTVTDDDDSPDDSTPVGTGGDDDDSPDDSVPTTGGGDDDDSPDDSPEPSPAPGGGDDDSPDDSRRAPGGGGDDSADSSPGDDSDD